MKIQQEQPGKKHKKVHENNRKEYPNFGRFCEAPNHVSISEPQEIKKTKQRTKGCILNTQMNEMDRSRITTDEISRFNNHQTPYDIRT